MGLFDQFPYTNFHELNLDWILQALKELEHTIDQFVSINALKYADPIQWNITKQYEKNTIVIDPLTGTAYISVQPVPSGVDLTREEYWTIVFDLGSFVTRAAKNFTDRWESQWTLTATFPSSVGDWLVWNDTLYKVLSNIVAGDQYVIDSNIKHFTIEETLGHLEDLSTTDKSSIVAALNEVAAEVLGKIGDLNDLDTVDKSTLVAAINEVLSDSNKIKYHISNLTDVTSPTTVAIPKNTLFWFNRTLCEAVQDIAIGDDLIDTVNYYPCSINSLFRNILNINNLEAVGTLTVNRDINGHEDLTINGNATIGGNNTIAGNINVTGDATISGNADISGILSLPLHANVDDYLSKTAIYNNLVSAKPIYVFIGDSYDSYSDWIEKTGNALGLDSDQVVNLAQDSSNLASGGWLSFLQTWATNNPDKLNQVVAVVCGGGINDSSDDWLTLIDGAIATMATYIRNTLPKAKLYLAYFGWALQTSSILAGRDWFRRSIAQMVYSRCGGHGAIYLSGMESALHDKQLLSADGLHPNSAGGTRIANYLASALRAGSCNVSASPTNATCNAADDAATLTGYVQESLFNGFYYLHIQQLAITGAVNQIIVGTGINTNILKNLNLLYADRIPDQDCEVTFVNANDQSEVTISGRLLFQSNGYLQFAHDATVAANFYASDVKAISLNIMLPTIET